MNLTKPRLDQFKITGSTVGDVYFPQTKLLLPFEGTNGATTTSDLSNSNYSMTMGGSTTISSAKSKVGSTSLYNPGGAGNYGAYFSDTVSLSGNFTMEWWEWVVSYANEGCSFVLNKGALASSSFGFLCGYYHLSTNASATGIYAASSVSSWDLAHFANGNLLGAHLTGQWVHRAVVRAGTNWYTYQNGVQYDTWSSSAAAIAGGGTYNLIGGGWADAHNNMYVDNFRVTKGIARYTSAFTPPATAYLTSAGDVNKQIIVNSTADGVEIGTGGINQARIAKAWANINGTGTISIRGSYNVSSLTDEATGKYKVNFSTAMADNNYVGFCAGAEVNSGTTQNHLFHLKRGTPISDILNTAYIYVASANAAGTQTDDGLFCVIVFGN
jgi:hypothetical protein